MKEIDVKQDTIIYDMDQLPSFDHYYFCGFHLGRCIYKKMKQLNKNNIGVVMNMSMIFPEDFYKHKISELELNNGYMYCPNNLVSVLRYGYNFKSDFKQNSHASTTIKQFICYS